MKKIYFLHNHEYTLILRSMLDKTVNDNQPNSLKRMSN